MAKFRFSRRAELDLYNIAVYTLRTWGEVQTGRCISIMDPREDFVAESGICVSQLSLRDQELDRAWIAVR